MIGTLISVGAGILGSVMSSRTARKQQEAQQAELDRQKAENAAWYNRRFYEDGTQRADVQRSLTRAQDNLRRNSRAASGQAAVTGASNATVAATKEANNQAYADMVSQAAATAEARKDAVEQGYLEQKRNLAKQQIDADAARANAKIGAINTAVQAVGTAAAGLEEASSNKIAANTEDGSNSEKKKKNWLSSIFARGNETHNSYE